MNKKKYLVLPNLILNLNLIDEINNILFRTILSYTVFDAGDGNYAKTEFKREYRRKNM